MRKSLFLCVLCLISATAFAQQTFDEWKLNFRQEALQQDVLPETLDTYVPLMEYKPEVIRLDQHQPEFKQTLCQYLHKRLSETRLKKAETTYQQHRKTLQQVESKYQVPAHYLLALWGLETNFGTTKGQFDVLSSLATLAFDTRRPTLFKKQLIALLKILQNEKIDRPKGSWAGAFGHFQFMPTTFLNYAVDFNSDNKRDIYADSEDAIASAANYLSAMGWDPKTRWGRAVYLPDKFNEELVGTKHPLSFWKAQGVHIGRGKTWSVKGLENVQAVLLAPWGLKQQAFLLYPNFYVIKKWNNSNWYALSVGLLSDMIAQRETFRLQDCNEVAEPVQTKEKTK